MNKIKALWYRIKSIPVVSTNYEKYIGRRKRQYIANKQTKEINENGNFYLETVEKLLESSNALYYTYGGTLLGIVRDQKLIKWDADIDYAVVITEAFDWDDLERIMYTAGYKKVREYILDGEIKEQAYQIEKMKIDFFGQFYAGDKMNHFTFLNHPNVKYPCPGAYSAYKYTLPKVVRTRRVNVDGVAVSVPENAEEVLEAIYTENWRTPDPNWKDNSGKCVELLQDKVGFQTV